MTSKAPGCFVLIGNGATGPNAEPLHSPKFDFNDEIQKSMFYMIMQVSKDIVEQDPLESIRSNELIEKTKSS